MDYPLQLPQQLSQHLKSLRRAAGLSQRQLAKRMGVSRYLLAAIERDPLATSVEQLFEVLRLMNVRIVLRD
ncbi:helix-turn-helix transcriptional regulator, partial [Listeria monocytogenes]|uniref:helix-turn-helix transcriptional regulator n=1 Tax=Listeria monocytogenes TaxID=1639 RepID=UPI003FA47A5B